MRSDIELADQMADMAPEMRQLLMWDVNTLARWDVLRCFLENDYTPATLDDIAYATARDTEELLTATGALVAAGWLSRRTVDVETQYTLTQERERRILLNQLHTSLQDHDFRLKAIYYWIHRREA